MVIEVNIEETVEVSDSVEETVHPVAQLMTEMTGVQRVFIDWDAVIRQSERERGIHQVRGPPGAI